MVYKLATELIKEGKPNLKFSDPNYYLYVSIHDYKNTNYESSDTFNLDEVYFYFQNYGKPYIDNSRLGLMTFKKINDDIYMELMEEKDLEFSSITKEVLDYQEINELFNKKDNLKYRIYFKPFYQDTFISMIDFGSKGPKLFHIPNTEEDLVWLYNKNMEPHYFDPMDYYRDEYEVQRRRKEFYQDKSWRINNAKQIKRFPIFHHKDVPTYKHINEKFLDITDGLFYIVSYYDDESVEIMLLDVYCLGYNKYEVISKKCLVNKNDFDLVNSNMPNNEVIYEETKEEKVLEEVKKRSLIKRIFNFSKK